MRSTDAAPCLELPAAVRRRLADEALAAGADEACGALLGTATPAGARVTDVAPLPNRATDPRRAYRLDPAELEPIVRTGGVIGFYHSHPDGPVGFSARDAAAAQPGYWYVVVGAGAAGDRPGEAALSAWRDGRRARIAPEGEPACRR